MTTHAGVLIDLTRRYCEPHRRYHSIRHVAEMLWRGRDQNLSEEQVMAVWYHDAIYEIPGDDNERASAALARSQLGRLGWAEEPIALVERIVLDTIEHVPTVGPAAIVIDLDLASLAGEPDEFDRNSAAIRAEYLCYGDAEFDAAQRRIFTRFLERERIYFTPWGAALEARARANLERALRAPPVR